ncbi:hypothetical protein ABN148_12415 [Klebsiella oxytoca]|uniref:hypothetical protein n=1 Tax=Klebsiella oxytoca TaxID=571 RepID=UPI0018AB4DDB|nr:hypothetical protein [Klebsiella oxytoca]MBF8467753.1 hypothetical protein [Klebsiella oxytoca]MBZ7702049.1 hypothetical protein [Klebsiella oxytoca]
MTHHRYFPGGDATHLSGLPTTGPQIAMNLGICPAYRIADGNEPVAGARRVERRPRGCMQNG